MHQATNGSGGDGITISTKKTATIGVIYITKSALCQISSGRRSSRWRDVSMARSVTNRGDNATRSHQTCPKRDIRARWPRSFHQRTTSLRFERPDALFCHDFKRRMTESHSAAINNLCPATIFHETGEDQAAPSGTLTVPNR